MENFKGIEISDYLATATEAIDAAIEEIDNLPEAEKERLEWEEMGLNPEGCSIAEELEGMLYRLKAIRFFYAGNNK